MSAKHTKGPWRYKHEPGCYPELMASDYATVALFAVEPSLANARRIVACVNACDGIPTAWLEGGAADIIEHSIALIKQRDELLEALKQIVAIKFSNWSDGEMRAIAIAAIKKAEGGAA